MKILYIANARIPTEKAHGIQIMKMCEAFGNEKALVELVLPRRFNWINKDPFRYYGIKRIFKITKLPCLDFIVFDKYIGHLGLWAESLTFSISVFFYILFRKADIFYTRDKLLMPLAIFKKNIIFETHTFPKNYFLYSFFLKRIKGIIVITQKLKELLINKGIAGDKIIIAPDGVDLAQFYIGETKDDCRKKLGLPFDKKIVLYSGHLYAWKGVDTLAEAARNFQLSISNYQFVFVGGTEKDIEEFRQKMKDIKNILIAGHRPHQEIPLWLKAADVLVLPNSGKEEISKHWTSPLKMFEYMASKRPIVASDLSSIREVLNEGNAILVEPDNPSALGKGIEKALEIQELADEISVKAFQDVRQYTWQKRAEKILSRIVSSAICRF